MAYTLQHIASLIQAAHQPADNRIVVHLLTDSRKLIFPENSLFFAISGPRRDGHTFIHELYERGLRCFVTRKGAVDITAYPGASFLEVKDVLLALQQLAANHRQQYQVPVIGITGSNGKTIVKEWLYQLMHEEEQIVRSPRSYNSQIGVPLSVWQLEATHSLAIFEAGISQMGEMKSLQQVMQPTIGVWTNMGTAHSEGFPDERNKALEKAQLFSRSDILVYCKEAIEAYCQPQGIDRNLFPQRVRFFSWSRVQEADLKIIAEENDRLQTWVTAQYGNEQIQIAIPFTDRISVDNAITCWAVMLCRKYNQELIRERMLKLEAVDMRMQLKRAVNHSYLLNDSYSNDMASLVLALDFLMQQAGGNQATVILSDILQSSWKEEELYVYITEQLCKRRVRKWIGIGPVMVARQALIQQTIDAQPGATLTFQTYATTTAFLENASLNQFRDEYILLKGARVFTFEKISQWLEQKVHQTVLEVNLTAMAHNLKVYQQHLQPSTKLMAMVKAFSYGSGSAEVARLLQFHKIDYLAVAYADEGVDLRKAGISLPIMVMNVDEAGFDAMIQYDLEPEIYSQGIYHTFRQFLEKQAIRQYPVHIKINTGMNRLGFEPHEAAELARDIREKGVMIVRSVLSHLAGSENPSLDDFTGRQVQLFEEACNAFSNQLTYPFIRHIANSAGIFRHTKYQFDMVRLGIGLYGVDSANAHQLSLQTVITLKSTIAQIRKVSIGETVGYNRKGLVTRDSLVATVRIGYADGYNRKLGNGTGYMMVHGKKAPVLGNVCMDMAMIDVTDIPGIKEGDEVEVFGKHVTVQELAEQVGTIPYEIMTGVNQRVKRVYVEE